LQGEVMMEDDAFEGMNRIDINYETVSWMKVRKVPS